MAGFDIATLTSFRPPSKRCSRCLALWKADFTVGDLSFMPQVTCPVCSVLFHSIAPRMLDYANHAVVGQSVFAVDDDDLKYAVLNYAPGIAVDLGREPLEHATTLAQLANELRLADDQQPPLGVLMRLLLTARSFVHITTFGLDQFTLAVLEMAAQRVHVCAVVSGIDDRMVVELEPSKTEAAALEVRIEGHRRTPGDQNHGKLIVVDGILAVAGSANLTHLAWRKAGLGMEIVDVVTDVDRVAELNNRHFAPHWARLDPRTETSWQEECGLWSLQETQDTRSRGLSKTPVNCVEGPWLDSRTRTQASTRRDDGERGEHRQGTSRALRH